VGTLEKLGFEQIRQRGSHVILPCGATPAVVPLHREAKIGTLNGILRQAQVSADVFPVAAD
jgi:predicted RNA binding protein YcfA (HicA-like mRNA interferase family)